VFGLGYTGVQYDEAQDAWTASVELGGREVFREHYGDPEIAAIGREIAIIQNRWETLRNFPTEDLAGLCHRFAGGLKYSLRSSDRTWHGWVRALGLSPEEFLRLAGLDPPPGHS